MSAFVTWGYRASIIIMSATSAVLGYQNGNLKYQLHRCESRRMNESELNFKIREQLKEIRRQEND